MGGPDRSVAALLRWALLLPPLVQAYLLPYTPQVDQQCMNPKREYYEDTTQKCCSLCPPGYKVLERCTEHVDTQCGACEGQTYTKFWSRADRCLSCSLKCTGGMVETEKCTPTQNRVCWCPSHQFCRRIIFGTCASCQSYQSCKKGYRVSVAGTNSKDVECAPCSPGTFSDVESHNATCRAHRICKSVRIPGNMTHDAVCHEPSVRVGIVQTTPPGTVNRRTHLPPLHSLTRSPALDTKEIQQPPKSDVSYVAGLVAGVMFGLCALLAVTVFYSAFRKKVPHCALPFGSEKQPLSSTEKAPGKWPHNTGALGQEEQNLLQISMSSSGSLDSPTGSEKSSEIISNLSSSTREAERTQQRSPPANSCSHQGGASAKQPNSRTHVNINCVVNVCNSDHSLQFQPLDGPAATNSGACSLAEEDFPLSKEERPLKREPKAQVAVEVEEDNLDPLAHDGGKPLPLSIQDVGMKTR
ncbi:tumor necrosis factor receptor superfamily member 1B-like [Tiliqua scincoides]|uniref:tumor necrosis factor receptor superfamily member 1B-like n=1 Tax=Tiliqua scincoides TaxID=71010 RepID=UPI0034625B74